jgi:dTDP-4-amino-4,6-dideoxygalactose transaminase
LKNSIDDLSIFGGESAFTEPLHVGRPNIGDRERFLERVNDMLDRRWLTNNGPYVRELEQRLSELLGVKHCIAFCNGSIALEIAAKAAGLTGEVIVPSFTFIATAHALQFQGITPVFCDIAPGTHHIDPARIEAMITPRTTGIVAVHVWGQSCDIEALVEVARRHNLKLLFDAAHALGCTYQGQMIGGFGDAEIFSFHATKFFNSFEGGAITTNNDEMAQRAHYMRNFGFAGYDRVEYIGTNGKMTEICAAMGLTSLESMDEFIAINHRNYHYYQTNLASIPGLKLFEYDASEKSNYQYVIAEVDESVTNISRDALVKVLHAENILARRYFFPGCHQMEPYRSYFPHAGLLLPNTEALTDRVMSLPNGTAVEADDIDRICELIRFCVENGENISQRLQGITGTGV